MSRKKPDRGVAAAFARAVTDGAKEYIRARDLPRVLALWPGELEDRSEAGQLRMLARLRDALCTERRRARAGHWSYDLNRHFALMSAYRAEAAEFEKARRKALRRLRAMQIEGPDRPAKRSTACARGNRRP